MLQDPENHTRGLSWRWGTLAALIALIVVPFRLTARTADQRDAPAQAVEQTGTAPTRAGADDSLDRLRAQQLALDAQQRLMEQKLREAAATRANQTQQLEQQLHDVQTGAHSFAFLVRDADLYESLRGLAQQPREQNVDASVAMREKAEVLRQKLREVQEQTARELQDKAQLKDQDAQSLDSRLRRLAEEAARLREAETQRLRDVYAKAADAARQKVEEDRRLKLKEDEQRSAASDADIRQRLERLKEQLRRLAVEIDRIQEQIK